MAFGSIFKTIKHKNFEYKPIYHDPEKEELDGRIKRAQREVKLEKENPAYIPNIKGKMKDYLITQDKAQTTHSNIRRVIVVITIGLLIAIFYYLVEITEFIFSLPNN